MYTGRSDVGLIGGNQFATDKAETDSTRIQREGDPTRIHRRTDHARFKAVKPDEWIRL